MDTHINIYVLIVCLYVHTSNIKTRLGRKQYNMRSRNEGMKKKHIGWTRSDYLGKKIEELGRTR